MAIRDEPTQTGTGGRSDMATQTGTRSNLVYCLIACLSFLAGAVVALGLASVVANHLLVPIDF